MTVKRILALVLTLALCVGICSASAAAAEEPAVSEDATVGRMIADMLDGEAAPDSSAYGGITDITVMGKTAQVRFHAAVPAELVAAIYDEQGEKLLGSGHVLAAAGEDTVSIPIEIDNMPSYFVAGAYLLDAETHEPLCEPRLNRMYTQALQELTNSTISDYDPDRVLNLDGSKKTNFLVFADHTVGCRETDGVTVSGSGGVYTVSNAPEKVRAMQPGDSLVYLYADGSSLAFKAKSVTRRGDDVILTEDPGARLTDVFEVVKIDTVTVGGAASDYALDGADVTVGGELKIPLPIGKEWSNDYGGKLSGNVTLSLSVSLQIYAAADHQYVKLEAGCKLEGTVSASQQIEAKIPMTALPLTVPTQVPGVFVTVTPYFKVGFTGSISLTGSVKVTAGFEYDSDTGGRILDNAPDIGVEPKVSGTVDLGVYLECAAVVLDEDLCKASVTGGAKISTSIALELGKTEGDMRHACVTCLKGNPRLMVELEAELAFIGLKDAKTPSVTLTPLNIPLKPFYYSTDHEEFGWGLCPYKTFRVTVNVTGADGAPADDAVLYGAGSNVAVEDGKAALYLAPGTYTLNVLKGDTFGSASLTVTDRAREVSIDLAPVEIVDSGACGNNVIWRLYNSGLMMIEGTGDMKNYSWSSSPAHWNTRDNNLKILYVVIGEGVTSVGKDSFDRCLNLVSVSLPSTVRSIGDWAFQSCESLESVPLPDGLERIGRRAFADSGLVSADIPGGVSFSSDGEQFAGCEALTKIRLSDGITVIPANFCSGCGALREVTLPKTLTQIGKQAFLNTGVEHISLPDGLASIGEAAFRRTPLAEILIPDSVTSIGSDAFSSCTSLGTAHLPVGLKTIPRNVFAYCSSLDTVNLPETATSIGSGAFHSCPLPSVTIPASVTTIGDSAFFYCSLTSIQIPGTVKSVGYSAFSQNNKLLTAYVEEGVQELGRYCFMSCASLTTVTLPHSLKTVGFQTFDDCVNLRSIYYDGTEAEWADLYKGAGTQPDEDRVTAAMIFGGGAADGAAPEPETLPEELVPADDAEPPVPAEPAETASAEIMETPTAADEPAPAPVPEAPDPLEEALPEEEPAPAPEEALPEDDPAPAEPDGELIADSLAAFTGSLSTGGRLQTAAFADLCPGAQYVLLAVRDPDARDLLAPENLLFIAQAPADGSGTLAFSFIPRTEEAFAAVAYGRSNKDLSEADITLRSDGTVLVVYGGEVLLEGRDFTVDRDAACVTVTGRGQYAGVRTLYPGGPYSAAVLLQNIVNGRAGDHTPADAAALLKR